MNEFNVAQYRITTGHFGKDSWIVVDDPEHGIMGITKRGTEAHMSHKGLKVSVIEDRTEIYLHGRKVK